MTIRSTIAGLAAGACSASAWGQWYWPPTEGVNVSPQCAGPGEQLVVTAGGDWPDNCPPNVARVVVDGTRVDVELATEPPPGFCLAVITAWSLQESFGPLPEGEYTVFVSYFIDRQEILPPVEVDRFAVDSSCALCYPDCDESGGLDFFDFLCFQSAFAAGEAYADCDDSGELDFFDFLCFQNAFAAGCP